MKPVFEGKHLLVLERDDWQYVERRKAKEAVAVLAETDAGQIVLTEQYRKPLQRRVVDFPAGLVGDEGDNTDPANVARRELEEETGYTRSEERRVGREGRGRGGQERETAEASAAA